jgi:hypothetical protein
MTSTGRCANLLLGTSVVACAWLAAFAIETAARLNSQAMRSLGADFPVPYGMLIDFVKAYGPWIVAVLITTVVVFLGLRSSARYLQACVVSAVVAALMVSLSVLALSLPLMMCGEFWPAWSDSAKRTCPGLK